MSVEYNLGVYKFNGKEKDAEKKVDKQIKNLEKQKENALS